MRSTGTYLTLNMKEIHARKNIKEINFDIVKIQKDFLYQIKDKTYHFEKKSI